MTRTWNGREWQDYCILLLQKRYATTNPHNLQLVPDRHQGDLGIEAFSHDGAAFQCYAAEEPLTVEGCYEKQRDKLTADLGKLQTKQDAMGKMLGQVVLERYVYLVHRHDSRHLITHATVKAAEVIAWKLPFISSNFRVVVETDADYAIERESLHALPDQLLEPPQISEEDRATWAADHSDLRGTASTKIFKVQKSQGAVDGVVDALTQQYLKGENALEKLRAINPEVHRGIIATRAHREEILALEFPPGLNDSQAKLASIARDFESSLLRDYPVLSESMAKILAWSAVADWLMRCPLDFEAVS